MAHGLNEHGHTEGRPPRLGHGARALGSGSVTDDAIRAKVHDNATLKAAFERINGLDRALYDAGRAVWCAEWARAARNGATCVAGDPPDALCAGAPDLAAVDAAYPPFS